MLCSLKLYFKAMYVVCFILSVFAIKSHHCVANGLFNWILAGVCVVLNLLLL